MLQAALHATLRPFLLEQAETLVGKLRLDLWRRGYCPVCGGRPDLACLIPADNSRRLVCAQCDTQWPYQRFGCPYCQNSHQDRISILADDSGRYRVYLCEACRRYLKTLDLRNTSHDPVFAEVRVTTFDLDRQAQERGYHQARQPAPTAGRRTPALRRLRKRAYVLKRIDTVCGMD